MVASALKQARRWLPQLLVFSALVLAAGAGVLTSSAFGLGSQTPTRTVTIDVSAGPTGATGPQGPAGPPGPKGEPGTGGAENCPGGTTFGRVILNAPGGHVAFDTCIVD